MAMVSVTLTPDEVREALDHWLRSCSGKMPDGFGACFEAVSVTYVGGGMEGVRCNFEEASRQKQPHNLTSPQDEE
jgi:hypothetical protein